MLIEKGVILFYAGPQFTVDSLLPLKVKSGKRARRRAVRLAHAEALHVAGSCVMRGAQNRNGVVADMPRQGLREFEFEI